MAIKHPKFSDPVYKSWENMKNRCQNPRNPAYKNYGGRGITVCERWQDFNNFREDMGNRDRGLSIERINNDGNYEPVNCRWATLAEQSKNRRSPKLSNDDVREIKRLKTLGLRQTLIGQMFGVRQDHVSRIINGQRRQGVEA